MRIEGNTAGEILRSKNPQSKFEGENSSIHESSDELRSSIVTSFHQFEVLNFEESRIEIELDFELFDLKLESRIFEIGKMK